MTIISSTPYPPSRVQFNGEEDDLGAKFVIMSLWPDFEIARWQLTVAGDEAFPVAVGLHLEPVMVNPNGATTIWTDGTTVFFGAIPIGGGGGPVTGSGVAGELAYWSGTNTITGEAALAYDAGANILTAGSIVRTGLGDPTTPSYSFSANANTGMYSPSTNVVGITANGVLKWSASPTAVTSTVIGIFPASASGASGFASIRLPQGAAPTTNLTNGDMWITAAGVFARVNGGTVGPFGSGGGGGSIGGTIDSTQVAYGVGVNTISGDAGFTYDSANNQLQLLSSSAALPAYSFVGDVDTGMYHVGANDLGFATNGVLRLDISATAVTTTLPVLLPAGTAGAPALAFSADATTGLYRIGASQLGVSTGGTLRLTLSTTAITSTLPVLHPDGSAAAPSISFASDTNTGFYSVGADQIGGSTGGTLRWTLSTTAVTSTLPFLAPNGTASAPTYSFSGDTNTGMYDAGADDLGFATGGTLRLDISTTAITSTLPILIPAGSLMNPTLAFTAETNTGLYWVGLHNIGITVNGIAIMDLTPTAANVNGDLNVSGLISEHTGVAFSPVAANPGGVLASTTVWVNSTDSNRIYFGSAPIDNSGTVTGTGVAGQIAYWDGVSDIAGSTGLVYDAVHTQIALGSGVVTLPSYSFVGDVDTGMYHVGANDIGFATNGVLALDISATAITSTLINILPASTTGGASVRLPHGTAPTSPVNGDEWTTTAGLFVRINGVTVGPLGAGTVTGTGSANQVTYWTGSTVIAGDTGMVYDATNDQLALSAGTAALPAYSIIGDLNTGWYGVAADTFGITTGGTVRLSISTLSVTSTLINILPASTTGAASERLPHGTAPSAPVDGDMWTTTAGLFVRINGVTVGPLAASGGGITGSGVAGQVTYWTGTSVIAGDAGMVYDAVNAQLELAAGTAALPSYTFIGDVDTGLYHIGANHLGLTTDGTLRLDISTTALTSTLIGVFPASTTAAASVRFPAGTAPTSPVDGDVWTTTAGLFVRINGVTVGPLAATSGTVTGTGSAGQVSYWTGTSAIAGNTGMVYDATNKQLALFTGTASLPSYAIVGNLNTGMYGVGTNDLGFSTNGVLRLDISTAAITSTLAILLPVGAAATPTLTFTSDPDTGLYNVGANDLGFATNGVLRVDISTTAVTSTLPFLGPNGTVGAPSHSFSGDPDTGMYNVGANDLGFATNGVLQLEISTTAITSTLINILPASTTSAASERLPHGAAPTSPVNGDMWTTTAGLFVRINGSTVGPLGTGGGSITGSGVAGQVTFWTGTSAIAGDVGMVYDSGNGQIALSNGTAALPSYAIVGNLNTGMYRVGANDLGFSTNGVLRFDISTTAVTSTLPFLGPNGTAGAPSYSFSGDPDTGSYDVGANDYGVATNGVLRWDVSTTAITSTLINIFPASTTSAASERLPHGSAPTSPVNGDMWTTTAGLFVRINGSTVGPLGSGGGGISGTGVAGQVTFWTGTTSVGGDVGMVYDAVNTQIALGVATAALPSYSFVGDLDTGMYHVGANDIGFSTSGTLRVDISTTAVTSTLPFLGPNGSAGAPTHSFSGDPDTGAYDVGANDYGVSTGGTLRWDVSTTAITSTLPLLGQNGTAGAPAISFSGDPDTGVYNVGANDLGIATNGVLRLDVSTTALTSTLIGIFPASTTGAASIRLPHGTAPTSPVNGDLWTTTAGLYAQINSGTVGPFGAGTVTGTGVSGQVSYWNGTSSQAGDTGFLCTQTSAVTTSMTVGTGLSAAGVAVILNGASGQNRSFSFHTAGVVRWNLLADNTAESGSNTGSAFALRARDDAGVQIDFPITIVRAAGGAMTFTRQAIGQNGTALLPAWSFSGDPNTGMYNVGADDLGFATNGTLRLDISTTAITSTLPIAMSSQKITGLAAATTNGDAVRYNEFQAINTSQITAGTLSSARLATNQLISTAGVVVDGGGSTLTTGSKGFIQVQFAGTITSWTVVGNASGSIVMDVKRSTSVTSPSGTSLVGGGNSPTVTAAQGATAAVSGWTSTTLAAGDILEWSITSVSGFTRVTVELDITRS